MTVLVKLTDQAFKTETCTQELLSSIASDQVAAVSSFTGIVRATNLQNQVVNQLKIEHYPQMTESVLVKYCEQAMRDWELLGVSLTHRYGLMNVGETIVHIVAVATHRAPAQKACSFLVEVVKTDVPLWKKEIGPDGEFWVEPPTK